MQHEGALKTNVQNGMPHGFLSVRTSSPTRYGQPHANIAALEHYLKTLRHQVDRVRRRARHQHDRHGRGITAQALSVSA